MPAPTNFLPSNSMAEWHGNHSSWRHRCYSKLTMLLTLSIFHSMLLSRVKYRVMERIRCELILITGMNIWDSLWKKERKHASTRNECQKTNNIHDKLIGNERKTLEQHRKTYFPFYFQQTEESIRNQINQTMRTHSNQGVCFLRSSKRMTWWLSRIWITTSTLWRFSLHVTWKQK